MIVDTHDKTCLDTFDLYLDQHTILEIVLMFNLLIKIK